MCITIQDQNVLNSMLTEVHQIVLFLVKYKDFIAACQDCSEIKDQRSDIDKQIQTQNDYITIIGHTIDGVYCELERAKVEEEKPTGEVNLDLHAFKSNLQAKNWFYGSTT